MRPVFLSGLLIFFINTSFQSPELKKFQVNGTAQGTTYHITYYAGDSIITKKQIDSLLGQVDSSLSLYKPYSLINQFNKSGGGIEADVHFIKVIKKAQEVYQSTDGLFDVTVFPLTDAWGFGPVRKDTMPDANTIAQLRSCVNSSLVQVKGRKVIKKKPCVRLDANGIAQGYTVDVLAEFFEERGVMIYLVELGGEIRVKGRKPGGEKMSIGIEAPGDDAMFAVIEKVIYLSEGAITTSGNYRRYYESNGKKITHLINPKTGYTLQNELVSVTVYAKDAITADGYDNAIMVMGLIKGLAFVEKHKELAAHFIYRKNDGTIADTASKRFRALLQP